MNRTKKQAFLFFVILSTVVIQQLRAQEISGDTIYVNAEAEVMVRFPTLPTFFNTVPSNAPYNFKTAGTGFTIIAKAEKTKPAPLMVTEGGRNHRFLIVFKKNIDYNNEAEIDYDFSTTKKIEHHISEKEFTKVAEPPVESKKEKKKKNTGGNNSTDYYALLEEGDNNIKKKDFNAAKLNFEAALAKRPGDAIPKQRLEEVKVRIAELERTAGQAKNKQYVDITATAKNNLNAKKYPQALEGFKKALELKPGDLYATHQIEKINKLIKDDNGKKEQDKLTDLYKEYMSAGEKALKKNQITDARIAFEQALIIKQNDPVAAGRLKTIDEKEKKQKEADDLENNYNNTIATADNLFKAGDYDEAKTAYTKAAGLFKRSWPQEQIKNINKITTSQLVKDESEKKKLIKQLEEEQSKKEKAENENNYKAAVKSADKYFKSGDYTNAALAYNKALSFDRQPWPLQQLKTIQKLKDQEETEKKKTALLAETDKQAKDRKQKEEKEKQALEKEFKAIIKDADKLFKKNDYQAARVAYVKAAGLSDDTWPQLQINKIDKYLDEKTALEKAEKVRLALEAEATAKYSGVIDKANAEFDKGNYIKARKLYVDASALKPAEKLPKEKIDLIQRKLDEIAAAEKAKKESLTLAAELKKKYDLAMSKAKSYYQKDDLVNAKNAYAEAVNIKPGEEEPKRQLKVIQDKLDVIAKENVINDQYDSKISMGDSLLIIKAFEQAITSYKDALTIKPSEYYPQTQIRYLQGELRNAQKEKAENEIMEAYRKEEELDKKYRDALKRANQAVTEKKYEVAKAAFLEVLAIRPDNEFAQQRVRAVTFQMEKEKLAKVNEATTKKEKDNNVAAADKKEKVKQIPDHEIMKITPVPYSPAELKRKYPGIDFTALPPEQPFNSGAINTMENANTFRQTLMDKPRLKLAATERKVKVTCQGINFEGTNVYLKFLVENNTSDDFLTGAMMLTWTKKSGNRIKLYPNYLYPAFLPIIPPGKEAVIIYVCKSYYITDNEKLNFELTDRLNKLKLEITIPGSVYNEEESR